MTLVEVMVVVSLLAILAALAVPRFSSVIEDTKAQHAASTMKELSKAISLYNVENDDWPRDVGRGRLPSALEPYIVGTNFDNDVSGGKWDYENWIGRGKTMKDGRRIGIALSLRGGDQELFGKIDELLDDGDLSTGNVQYGRFYSNCLLCLIEADG